MFTKECWAAPDPRATASASDGVGVVVATGVVEIASLEFAAFAVVVTTVVVGATVVVASSVTAKPPIGKLATSFSGSGALELLLFPDVTTAGAAVLDAKDDTAFNAEDAGDMGLDFFTANDSG